MNVQEKKKSGVSYARRNFPRVHYEGMWNFPRV